MSNEKQAVALSSMAASGLMTAGKLVVGLMTGSLGILSEALHSLLDLGATILTFMAVRVSDKPADVRHPYGHGKIESVAALVETALLFVTSFWIMYEAAHRLFASKVEVETTWWSIAVIVASIVIDLSRARALKHVAEKTRSEALAADALHFSSDVYSSAVVLLGLGFVAIGWTKGDAIAAIGVSLFVCHAGWVMGRRTIDTLIDTAPDGAVERITELVSGVDEVAAVSRVRVRPAGSVVFVDAEVAVGRGLPQTRIADIRQKIVTAVQAQMPEAEVTVLTHPLALDSETIHQRVMIIAANHNASVHHITAHHTRDRLFVGFDLEVSGTLTLREAHKIASLLEENIRSEFGEATEVETHIEPLHEVGTNGEDVSEVELASLHRMLDKFARETGKLDQLHKLRARKTDAGLIVTFHCRTAPDQTVAEVHDLVDGLERQVRQARLDIWRVIAHAEPDNAAHGN